MCWNLPSCLRSLHGRNNLTAASRMPNFEGYSGGWKTQLQWSSVDCVHLICLVSFPCISVQLQSSAASQRKWSPTKARKHTVTTETTILKIIIQGPDRPRQFHCPSAKVTMEMLQEAQGPAESLWRHLWHHHPVPHMLCLQTFIPQSRWNNLLLCNQFPPENKKHQSIRNGIKEMFPTLPASDVQAYEL